MKTKTRTYVQTYFDCGDPDHWHSSEDVARRCAKARRKSLGFLAARRSRVAARHSDRERMAMRNELICAMRRAGVARYEIARRIRMRPSSVAGTQGYKSASIPRKDFVEFNPREFVGISVAKMIDMARSIADCAL